jgi:hypothetical protein
VEIEKLNEKEIKVAYQFVFQFDEVKISITTLGTCSMRNMFDKKK